MINASTRDILAALTEDIDDPAAFAAAWDRANADLMED